MTRPAAVMSGTPALHRAGPALGAGARSNGVVRLGVLPILPPARSDLALLRAVLKHGSVEAAARAVKTTHQAADRRIAHLERRLGVPLVEPGHDGERLTQSGWVLLSAGSRLLHAVEHVLGSIRKAPRRTGTEMLPTLRLATFGSNWCTLADDLAVRVPGMLLNPITANPSLGLSMFERHEADAAYIWAAPGTSPTTRRPAETTVVVDEPLWVAMRADHPCAGQPTVSLSDLTGVTWIVGAAPECRAVLEYACAGTVASTDVLIAESAPQVRGLVGNGLGVALVSPLVNSPPEGARLMLRALREPRTRRLLLVTDPRVVSAELAARLVAALRDRYVERARERNPGYAAAPVVQGLAGPDLDGPVTTDGLFAGLTLAATELWDGSGARSLEPEDVYVLRVINEYGSLNQAAPALLTTQPALTRRICRLEQRLGMPLLIRGPRGTALTPWARELLDGVCDAEVAFRSVVLDCCRRRRRTTQVSAGSAANQ